MSMNVAIIGAGWAGNRHAGVLQTLPDVKIVGHVVRDPKKAAAQANTYGGRSYADLNSLLAAEKVDAVWITVPPDGHDTLESTLIQRGIPFFVEKPLSADRQTAETIGNALEKRGLVAGVGYHWRASDMLPAVREKLSERPASMVLGFWLTTTPSPAWWRVTQRSGGQFVEQITHLVDLSRALLGNAHVRGAAAARPSRPKYPDADVAGVSAAVLQYENGVVGSFAATCLLAASTTVQLQLVCEGLMITITGSSVIYDYGSEKREIKQQADPFVSENRTFIEAVQRNDSSLLYSSYADALRTHRLCHDITERSLSQA